jgi:hypothetical protein
MLGDQQPAEDLHAVAETTAHQLPESAGRGSRFPDAAALRSWLPHVQVWALLAAAALLWLASVDDIDPRLVTDIGLVSQVPPAMILGIALLALAFTLSMRLEPFSAAAPLVATLLLIVTIHGLPAFVEDAPRFPTAYLHAGFTDTIADDGALLTRVDARFSWPLFFTLGALVTQIADVGNAIELQTWAAIGSNVLYLGPLLVIFGALTSDRRQVWTAVFLFYTANWIGQDYYAPQAFNFLLYLTSIAIVLRWFRRPAVPSWMGIVVGWIDRRFPAIRAPMREQPVEPQPPVVSASPLQRASLLGVIVLLAGVSVASHQLTPFALLGAVAALALLGRIQLPGLPVLIAVFIGLWISYMTVAFLAGHLVGLLSELGAPGEAATAGVTRRLSGSPGHVFIVQFRLVMTLGFWLLAAAGAIRRFRAGHLDIDAMALAAVPFGLLLLQAYGGELLLRIYLFTLPFMAYLASGVFFPTMRPLSWPATRVMAAVAALMVIALLVAKHGNERADSITADELAAIDRLYATAPSGSLISVVNTWGAVRYREFTDYRYTQVPEAFLSLDLEQLNEELVRDVPCTYLVITRSQQAAAEIFWGYTESYYRQASQLVIDSGYFEVVHASPDATILATVPSATQCTEGWQ